MDGTIIAEFGRNYTRMCLDAKRFRNSELWQVLPRTWLASAPNRAGGDLPSMPVLRSSARGCCMVATVVSTQGQACAIVSRPLNHQIMASLTLLSVQLFDAPDSRGMPRGSASTLRTSQRGCARRLS